MTDRRYGFFDDTHHDRPFKWKAIPLILALLFLIACWLFLTQKLLFGHSIIQNGALDLSINDSANWISETYDNINWRTNEGNLQTYGAWDLEAHVWKSEFVLKYWPDIFYNPYWYLGMPLFKYYQPGFYVVHIAAMKAFGLSAPYASTIVILFGHLAAVLMTFFLCLRVSRRYFVSAMCAFFLLANTFMSLRSYGWEPITVVFLWLFPLGLYVFLREPLRPFRFGMLITLAIAYLMHPLIWFSLCMTMGLYLFSLAISASHKKDGIAKQKVLTQYIFLVVCSLLIGGIQSVPQFTYQQVTSGAHMGVKYLPFYHIEYNIISPKSFFLSPGDLKGPGPIVGLALLFLIVFTIIRLVERRKKRKRSDGAHHKLTMYENAVLRGFALTVVVMVAFYYLELFNIFPMNLLRSVQYHRIMPEFIVASAVLIAAISATITSKAARAFYYITMFSFVIGGMFVIYDIQTHWATTADITDRPEFFHEDIPGRISMTYTEQSISVRNSFTEIPQTYGYYEQGITNSYDDEIFSVSSGFHNVSLMILYLRATDVTRLYVNREAGIRNIMVQQRLNGTLPYIEQNYRYAYYAIPIRDPSFAQAVSAEESAYVQSLSPGCREIYKDIYCGSVGEEFVTKDPAEAAYLQAYVNMLENKHSAKANFTMLNPDNYRITVANATNDTAVVIKMTKDRSWQATIDGAQIPISDIGPDFMIVYPHRTGEYTIMLKYRVPVEYYIGAALSIITLICTTIFFIVRPKLDFNFPEGDMK